MANKLVSIESRERVGAGAGHGAYLSYQEKIQEVSTLTLVLYGRVIEIAIIWRKWIAKNQI